MGAKKGEKKKSVQKKCVRRRGYVFEAAMTNLLPAYVSALPKKMRKGEEATFLKLR